MIKVYFATNRVINQKVGAYSYVIVLGNDFPVIHSCKRYKNATNSKIEVLGSIHALKHLIELNLISKDVMFYTTSGFLINIFKGHEYSKSPINQIITKLVETTGLFNFYPNFIGLKSNNYWQNLSYSIAKETSLKYKIL
jgi:ribonuclease HI